MQIKCFETFALQRALASPLPLLSALRRRPLVRPVAPAQIAFARTFGSAHRGCAIRKADRSGDQARATCCCAPTTAHPHWPCQIAAHAGPGFCESRVSSRFCGSKGLTCFFISTFLRFCAPPTGLFVPGCWPAPAWLLRRWQRHLAHGLSAPRAGLIRSR